MTKLRDDFLRTEREKPPAAPAGTAGISAALPLPWPSGPHRARPRVSISVPEEILPAWGPLKRFSASVDTKTYNEVVLAATWIYEWMQSYPARCRVRYLKSTEQPPPPPGVKREKVITYMSTPNPGRSFPHWPLSMVTRLGKFGRFMTARAFATF
jgi:hypothetical protein